eukprot:1152272-Pelagomonas_calceolata.AAC.11
MIRPGLHTVASDAHKNTLKRGGLARGWFCTHMSTASLGLLALTNSTSASPNRPSSSKNMAYFRCTCALEGRGNTAGACCIPHELRPQFNQPNYLHALHTINSPADNSAAIKRATPECACRGMGILVMHGKKRKQGLYDAKVCSVTRHAVVYIHQKSFVVKFTKHPVPSGGQAGKMTLDLADVGVQGF